MHICPGDGCTRQIQDSREFCAPCENKVRREAEETQRRLDRLLASYAAWQIWLREHGSD